MQITKDKDHVLFKNKDGEYHLSLEEFNRLGDKEATKLATEEIAKKLKSEFNEKMIDFKRARELGFCKYGIKDFCNMLTLDINKQYTIKCLLSVLTTEALFKYPTECRKIFGIDRIIKKFGGIEEFILNNKGRDCFSFVINNYRIPERTLGLLACEIALNVLPNFTNKYPDDDRPEKAINAKLLHLDGLISDDELSATSSAANSAAYSAANSAASSAAYSAAYSATNSAAYSATNSATSSAANSAAYSAAYSATSYTAYPAAYSAANSAAYSVFCDMLLIAITENYETYELFLKELNNERI